MISCLIATYGDTEWAKLAAQRAFPSALSEKIDDIVFVHDKEGTIASARNEAAERATRDWLLMLDADDQLNRGYVAAMERAISEANFPEPLLVPAVQYVSPTGIVEKPKFWPECDFKTGNWLIIGTLLRKSLFQKVGGFRDFPHGLEDWNFWARCVRAGGMPIKVPGAIYLAHRNSNSKHHALRRNNRAYQAAYQEARKDAWPELYS